MSTHSYYDRRLKRPSAWSGSAVRDSIVATDPSIGLTIHMPWRWPFASLGGHLRVAVSGLSGWPGVGFRRLDARFGVLRGFGGKGRGRCWSEWQGREQRLGRPRRRRCAGCDEPASKRFGSNSRFAAGLGGTSSSITTGTSGSAGFALAATTGCGASTKVAGPVVSAVAAGPNESAMIERVTPIANNNANASHMTVCFIAASPRPIE